jgi:hypothetical protein
MKQIKVNELRKYKSLLEKILKHLKTRQYFEIKTFSNLRFGLNQYVIVIQIYLFIILFWQINLDGWRNYQAYFFCIFWIHRMKMVQHLQMIRQIAKIQLNRWVFKKYWNFNDKFFINIEMNKLPKILRNECFKIK